MLSLGTAPKHLVALLQHHADKYPSEVAYIFLAQAQSDEAITRITYSELAEKARLIGSYLHNKGLSFERVLLLYPPGIDFITAFMGCLYAGAIAVPLACPSLAQLPKNQALITSIMADAEAKALLAPQSHINLITAQWTDWIKQNNLFIYDINAIHLGALNGLQLPKIQGSTITHLQYSSGSTAVPKGIIIRHQQLLHNIKYTAKAWHYGHNSVTLEWAPSTHIYGLVCGLLVPLYTRSIALIMPPEVFINNPAVWLEAITNYHVSHSGCPNFGYERCINEIKAEELSKFNLASWRVATNGGEPVQYSTLLRFSQKFSGCGFKLQNFCSAYGMSELAGTIAVTPYQKIPHFFDLSLKHLENNEVVLVDRFQAERTAYRTFVSNGQLLPGLKAAIIDPDTLRHVPKGKIGEIWLTGKALASGYWHRAEITREAFSVILPGTQEHYFRTGDLGFIHNKEICLTGRLKEVIIVRGKKYYPLDLEITAGGAIKIFAVPQHRTIFSTFIQNKEAIIVVQEITQENTAHATNIIQAIKHALLQNHGLEVYAVVLIPAGSLPKTASGKPQRKICQQQFLEGKLTIIKDSRQIGNTIPSLKPSNLKVESTKLENYFLPQVIALLATTLGLAKERIDLNLPLSEYNFDSINVVKFTNLLNDTYHLSIAPTFLFEHTTLKTLFQHLLTEYNAPLLAYYQLNQEKVKLENSAVLMHLTSQPSQQTDIAIIGMSGLLPKAANLTEFWQNLISGKDSISETPTERFDWKIYYDDAAVKTTAAPLRFGGFVDTMLQFDANFFHLSPREVAFTDPQQRIFLQVAWQAIEDAGYAPENLPQFNIGLFVGVFNNDYAALLQKQDLNDAYFVTGTTNSILANRISYLLNLHGPSVAIDTACSSSLVALHQAIQSLHEGDCDVALVGGVNALLAANPYLAASKAGMLSPDGQCKTFDKNANGYVRAEGALAILIKPLPKALADGDHIYAVIKGTAVNHGGHVNSLTVPNPIAQAEVIIMACQRAQIDITSLSYIETHGTGTPLGDPIEINGLKKAFAHLAKAQNKSTLLPAYCGLGSVKTHLGHLESAAGLAGLVKTVLALQHQTLPGNLHFSELNPYIELTNSPFYLLKQTQAWPSIKDKNGLPLPRRAGISSFGFGGTNAHVIIEEFIATGATVAMPLKPAYLLTLSAKTVTALQQRLQDLQSWLSQHQHTANLTALSYTLNAGRKHFSQRCAFIVASLEELMNALDKLQQHGSLSNTIFCDEISIIELTSPPTEQMITTLCQALTDNKINNDPTLYRHHLKQLAEYYLAAGRIDWEILYEKSEKKRLSLPTYPFETEYYPLPAQANTILQHEPENAYLATLPQWLEHKIKVASSSLLKLEAKKITITALFGELGFDSITLKELALQLENEFSIQLTPAIFFTHDSIHALCQYLLQTETTALQRVYTASQQGVSVSNQTQQYIASPVTQLTQQSTPEPIAIIGLGGLLPQSKDLTAFWQHLIAGDDLVVEIPPERFDWQHYYDAQRNSHKTISKWGGFLTDIDKFDAEFFHISKPEAQLLDPQHRLLLQIVYQTIEDAGYDPLSLSGQNIGLFAGVEFNDYATLLTIADNKTFHGYRATGNSPALLANRISYFFNLHGPSETIATACSSSLVAIHQAVQALRHGECTMAIAGGASLLLNPETLIITSQLNALSADGRCKTFDKSANGYVKGEGVAAILLKPLAQAKQDGDYIYAVIKASVTNHGGKAQSLTAPNAKAQSELLIKAYREAQVDPLTVTYIETHGTGTELGDPIEIEGLKLAFNTLLSKPAQNNLELTPYCGLGSVKSQIGHLEPASGVVGLIKVVLAMQHQTLPGNLHFSELNPYINLSKTPFYIVNKTQPWAHLSDNSGQPIPYRAGISSFGFGGTNAHVVIEEFSNNNLVSPNAKPYYLVVLSAKKAENLQSKISDLQAFLLQRPTIDLAALSFTLASGRSHFNLRYAFVIASLAQLQDILIKLSNQETPPGVLSNAINSQQAAGELVDKLYQNILATLHDTAITPSLYQEKLLLLADLYIKGYPIDWQEVYGNPPPRRLAGLPTYPFSKQHYWFNDESIAVSAKPSQPAAAQISSLCTEKLLTYLQTVFAEKLQLNPTQIAVDTTYEIYGIDSLLGLEILKRLESDFGTLPKTLLYEKNQLTELADYLQKSFPKIIERLFATEHASLAGDQHLAQNPLSQLNLGQNYANQRVTLDPPTAGDIAIIGLHGIYPQAKNLTEFWQNLVNGRDCISEIPLERWNYKDYPITIGTEEKYYKYGGFIADIDKFDPLFFNIAPREAMLMDPQERLFMQCAWATLEDAGYTRERLKEIAHHQVGVFVGATYNFYPLFIAEEWQQGNRLPLDIQMFSLANRVSYFLNLSGPSYPVDTACSSSLAAIHLAYESLRRGECQMALAGGVNLSLHPCKYHMLGSYGFLSEQGRCASFAAGGTGYVPGEGVGAVLLKPLALAEQDGDRIYGIIKSSSMNHGGKTSGYTVPNPNAQGDLIKHALAQAAINPRTISYIEAHGTGTALGDPIEVRGLQQAFAEYTQDKQFCAIGSVKSNIGHLEAAAGISQLTKVLLQLHYNKLVPSLHAATLNPYIDFANTAFFVQRELTEWRPIDHLPRRAGISSFGAGGTNVHIIVEEYRAKAASSLALTPPTWSCPVIFVLSALTSESLQRYAENLAEFFLQTKPAHSTAEELNHWLNQVCYTLQLGREAMPARLAIVASDYATLLEKLQHYIIKPTLSAANVFTSLLTEPIARHKMPPAQLTSLLTTQAYPTLAKAWVEGTQIDWQQLYGQARVQMLALPTYPFALRRCWVNSKSPSSVVTNQATTQPTGLEKPTVAPAADLNLNLDLNAWLYQLSWEQKNLELNTQANHANANFLIFSDTQLGLLLQDELGAKNCLYCFAGDKFIQWDDRTFYLDPTAKADYQQLFTEIYSRYGENLQGIVYLWGLSTATDSESHLAPYHEKFDVSLPLLNLLQTLTLFSWPQPMRFALVTRDSQPIAPTDHCAPWPQCLWSLTRIFAAEHPTYQILCLDLDQHRNLREEAHWLRTELQQTKISDNSSAYRAKSRYVVRLNSCPKPTQTAAWQAPEAVLISGGLGALGTEVAHWLVTQGTRYLLLIGTTPLPPQSEWPASNDSALREKINQLTLLQQSGAQVIYHAADIADNTTLVSLVAEAEAAWQKTITGVFHLAGITTDNVRIEHLSHALWQQVFRPKVQGALALHEFFKNRPLSCFVLFSSIAALPYFGMSGLSAYAAANAFLNGLAAFRQQQGLPALSINWAAWADKGMSFKYNHSAFLNSMGMSTLALKQGIALLAHLLAQKPDRPIAVFKIDWQKFSQVNPETKRTAFFSHFIDQQTITEPKITAHNDIIKISTVLAETLAQSLQLNQVEIDDKTPLRNYGLDSVLGINFVGQVSQHFPDILSPMDLYRYPTISQLAKYIAENCSGTTSQELMPATKATDALLAQINQLNHEEIVQLLKEELKKLDF